MFHLHILGAIENHWLSNYDGSKYSNDVMGRWYNSYKLNIKIYLLYVNHPVHPV